MKQPWTIERTLNLKTSCQPTPCTRRLPPSQPPSPLDLSTTTRPPSPTWQDSGPLLRPDRLLPPSCPLLQPGALSSGTAGRRSPVPPPPARRDLVPSPPARQGGTARHLSTNPASYSLLRAPSPTPTGSRSDEEGRQEVFILFFLFGM